MPPAMRAEEPQRKNISAVADHSEIPSETRNECRLCFRIERPESIASRGGLVTDLECYFRVAGAALATALRRVAPEMPACASGGSAHTQLFRRSNRDKGGAWSGSTAQRRMRIGASDPGRHVGRTTHPTAGKGVGGGSLAVQAALTC